MILRVKVNVDEAGLKKKIEKHQQLATANIQTILKNEGIPVLIDKIMEGYDVLSERADTLPEDPSNPAYWREEFRARLHEDFSDTFVVVGNRITVKLGDTDVLGYDPSGSIDKNDSEPLHWLVFYLEGLAGDWGFISPETYSKLKPWGGGFQGWGRFGQGFMIDKNVYLEQGFDKKVPWEDVRHPFSGFAPLDIFAEALNEWRIGPFVEKALRATASGRRL